MTVIRVLLNPEAWLHLLHNDYTNQLQTDCTLWLHTDLPTIYWLYQLTTFDYTMTILTDYTLTLPTEYISPHLTNTQHLSQTLATDYTDYIWLTYRL